MDPNDRGFHYPGSPGEELLEEINAVSWKFNQFLDHDGSLPGFESMWWLEQLKGLNWIQWIKSSAYY